LDSTDTILGFDSFVPRADFDIIRKDLSSFVECFASNDFHRHSVAAVAIVKAEQMGFAIEPCFIVVVVIVEPY